ncbi:essential NTPase required for small ribosome subunit synthesis [Exidia glandulosa HHB12029]|uniref:Adenylate kinase isoenzyme 6 homolog n=1 Tax=Exidia glandulosa HHB12029 TaxID=1314781 RepID=A0A165Q2U6_EXIGL|nr:essential NTPase required for small ribosome subunit synthesis [Exidia glandulosa HHB12029]
MVRRAPNIVVTGTPGTGKSTTAELIAGSSTNVPMRHFNISELVKQNNLYERYDEEWDSYVVDEDKLLDWLEPQTADGGLILDWHACEPFPERWIDLVVVLRCDHTKLWERLEARGYPLKKIQENNESEIMEVILAEARENYTQEIVVELASESTDELQANVERIVQWIENWVNDHPDGV